jgi:hypothetical protein
MARPQKPFRDSTERFAKHLPRGKDVTLIVLKTHLLAEVELNELLELRLPHPEALYQSRFTFIQRLCILEAISADPEIHLLARAMASLNAIRNSLAHQLEAPNFQVAAADFIHHAFYAAYDASSRQRKARYVPKKKDFTLNSLKSASAIVIGLLARYKALAVQAQAVAQPDAARRR